MLKRFAQRILSSPGGLLAMNRLTAGYPRIFMYHRFAALPGEADRTSVELFDRQVAFIKEHYHPLSLAEFEGAVVAGDSLPANSVMITVDDGYQDFHTYAFPVLQKHAVPATVFVSYDFLEKGSWLWPDLIAFLLDSTGKAEVTVREGESQRRYSLATAADRRQAWSDIADHCLAIGHRKCLDFIDHLARDLGVRIPEQPTPDYRALSWDQTREMAAQGIAIGAHTCSHARLTTVDDRELAHEIVESKGLIEEALQREVSSFAYPFGSRSDIDERAKEMARQAGYRVAFAAYFGNNFRQDRFEINRVAAADDWGQFLKDIRGRKVLEGACQALFP
jgi:peptidoglycan/xylan/chitin deacetylase (PgdA/CDA1 family)